MAIHTIAQTKRKLAAVDGNRALLGTLSLDAMALVSDLSRTAAAVRNRLEQGPLAEAKLSWSAYQVLWIVWSWQPVETRDIASEAGLGKAALSGVLATLERRDLIKRSKSRQDARIVEVALTATGQQLFESLLPQVNAVEVEIESEVAGPNRALLVDLLRAIGSAT